MSFIEASRRRKTCLPPGRSSSRGPRVVPMAWGGCVGAAGYPMGCQIGRLTCTKRHWRDLRRPLKFPNLTIQVSLTRSSFGHVLEGSPGPPGSIWRRPRHPVIDTANLGLGVRPLGRLTGKGKLNFPLGFPHSHVSVRVLPVGISVSCWRDV